MFLKIEITNDCANGPWVWRLTQKDGTVIFYGNEDITKGASVNNIGNWVFWNIYKVVDKFGNYYEYVYDNSDNNNRIKEINFTGNINAGLTPYNKIEFEYSIRKDKNTTYAAGLTYNQIYILDNIKVTGVNNTLYKNYNIKHGYDDMYSYVTEIAESGTDGSLLNSTIFKYGETDKSISTWNTNSFISNGSTFTYKYSGDFNGDGVTDILSCEKQVSTSTGGIGIKNFSIWKTDPSLGTVFQSTPTIQLNGDVNVKEKILNGYSFISSDFNGDGKQDILLSKFTSGNPLLNSISIYTCDNTLTNIANTYTYNPPQLLNGNQDIFNVLPFKTQNYLNVGDFDGDGKSDFITMLIAIKNLSSGLTPELGAFYTRPYTPNGDNIKIHNTGTNNETQYIAGATNIYPIDFNGDGKTDLMTLRQNECKVFELIKDNNGSSEYHFKQLYSSSYPNQNYSLYFGDFNGDGKTDFLAKTPTGNFEIANSTGQQFVVKTFSFTNTPILNNNYHDVNHKLIIADVNADGKSDIIQAYNSLASSVIELYYSNGSEFNYNIVTKPTTSGLIGINDNDIIYGNFNTNGFTMLNSRFVTDPAIFVKINQNGTERLLSKVTNGLNATIEFNYTNLIDPQTIYDNKPVYVNNNNNNYNTYPLITVQFPIYCVSNVFLPNGNVGTNEVVYQYEDAIFSKIGKGFIGYKKIIQTDKTQFMQTLSVTAINATYHTTVPQIKSMRRILPGQILNEYEYIYNFTNLASYKYIVQLQAVNILDGMRQSNTAINFKYDNFNNVIEKNTQIHNLENEKIVSNYINLGGNVPYLPDKVTIYKTRIAQPTVAKTVKYDYYNNGILKAKTDFLGLPKQVNTNYEYNSFGNLTKETKSAAGLPSKVLKMDYDNNGRFMIHKSTACNTCGVGFNQTTSYAYHQLYGLPIFQTSSDCQVTSFKYDGFGKLVKTTMPTGVTIKYSEVWDLAGLNKYYKYTEYDGKPDTKIYYDGLNREIKKEMEMMANVWNTIILKYDYRGFLESKSNSFILGLETPQYTNYNYDLYQRIVTEDNGINTYSYNYNYVNTILSIRKTDLTGKSQITYYDAASKTIYCDDPGGRINYEYTSWGDKKQIVQNGALIIKNKYDDYNNLIKITDANAGAITRDYDAYGYLIKETDAKGITHDMKYDELGRIITKSGPEGVISYDYYCRADKLDHGGKGVNLNNNDDAPTGFDIKNPDVVADAYNYCCNDNVTKITNFNGVTQSFEYDAYAKLIKKTEVIDATNFVTSYNYDGNDNLISTIYPSNIQINNNYDLNGFLLSIDDNNGMYIFQTGTMNGMGQITQYGQGNGNIVDIKYQNGLPINIQSSNGFFNQSYIWDFSTGNLKSRIDHVKNLNENFTYDNLNRLTSSQVFQSSTNILLPLATYQYDPYPTTGTTIGNIKTNENGYYRYAASQVNAQSSIANTTLVNAPPLNIATDEQKINYSPFMRVAQISENGYQQNFEYWPSYERIKSVLNQNGNLIETKYYFGDYEKQIINGGATTDIHYINSPIGICAILLYDGTDVTTYYLQKDYLGSLNVICDVNGNLVAEQNFNAWGKARNANTWNSNDPLLAKPTWLYRGFTGHEDMPQFGLINMNARLYDPTIGKMISPDNYVSNPNHTQSYNRYAYANNNPLNKIDPTGNVPIAFYAVFWVGAVVTDYTASYLAGEDKSLEQSAADVTNSLKEVSSLSITIYSADGVSISLNPLATVLTGAPAISLGVRVNDYNTIVLNTSVSLDGGSKYSAGWVYYDKKNDNGWMFSYTAFMGNNKFVQDNLSASINNKGFRFSFSEDIFTGDKFRTGAFEVGYGPVSIGAILYTSQHGSFKEAMKNEKGFINTSRYYKSALQYQPGSDGKYSALYAGLNVGGITLRAGVNSPKVGDAVQGFIHTWGGTYLFNYGGDPHQNTPLFNWNFPTTFYGTVSPVDPLNLY